jgi:hypothetical protein
MTVTGWCAFDWLDRGIVGSTEAVTAYCIGFVILAPLSKWQDALEELEYHFGLTAGSVRPDARIRQCTQWHRTIS